MSHLCFEVKGRVPDSLLIGIGMVVKDVEQSVEIEFRIQILVVQTSERFLGVMIRRCEGLFRDVVSRSRSRFGSGECNDEYVSFSI